ncbi:MAG: 4Fe-4S binding protein [Lachnospiraceae bacterium]|nr:4Fe-4S binding protein [Lachnospiraceae bacterium]
MKIKEKKRRLTQLVCALLYNCNFKGFAQGKIYQGKAKSACVPGLNCYSCPGAAFSCPLGSLQSALVSSKYKINYYILGMLLLFGVIFGRIVCGFLCPFGLFQELLYKLPTKKIKKGKWSRILSYLKYVILVVFVVVIPLVKFAPGFCKYICPAGTLEGGIPLVTANEQLRTLVGTLFMWKIIVLVIIIISAVFVFRSFCRFVCPLGAIYSLFYKVSFCGVRVDKDKCVGCDACVNECLMDVKSVGDRECVHCGECMGKCPTCAISYKKIV